MELIENVFHVSWFLISFFSITCSKQWAPTPFHYQWSFSPAIRFLYSTIEPQRQHLCHVPQKSQRHMWSTKTKLPSQLKVVLPRHMLHIWVSAALRSAYHSKEILHGKSILDPLVTHCILDIQSIAGATATLSLLSQRKLKSDLVLSVPYTKNKYCNIYYTA